MMFECGSPVVLSRTNRGHDLTVNGIPISLKTEAAAAIKRNSIHVSKWMELGRGEWKLESLLSLFLEHLSNYDRIFTLRCLIATANTFEYELVEIPKSLLLNSQTCTLEIRNDSKQNPKPGYGYVRNCNGELEYALYFDGGSERKLQIKHLAKTLCIVHGSWKFDSLPL